MTTKGKINISITVNVTEGERYVVSGVKLEGNYLDREDEFKSLVTIKPGQPYNADQVAVTAAHRCYEIEAGCTGVASLDAIDALDVGSC